MVAGWCRLSHEKVRKKLNSMSPVELEVFSLLFVHTNVLCVVELQAVRMECMGLAQYLYILTALIH